MAKFDPSPSSSRYRRDVVLGSLAGALSIATIGVGRGLGRVTNAPPHEKVIAWSCALVLLVAGNIAVRHLARALGYLVARRATLGAGASLRLLLSGVGYLLLLFALFGVLGVSLQRLLIGAGLAGVVLGIAAQQSLGNVFASVILLFARPFVVGEAIRVRSGVIGNLDATVLAIGLTYVTVRTEDGILKIPNSVMLASGIGRPVPPTNAP